MNDIEIKEIIKLLVEYKTNNSKIFELEKYGNKVLEVALDEEMYDELIELASPFEYKENDEIITKIFFDIFSTECISIINSSYSSEKELKEESREALILENQVEPTEEELNEEINFSKQCRRKIPRKEELLNKIFEIDIKKIRKIKVGDSHNRAISGRCNPISNKRDVILYSEPGCLESNLLFYEKNIMTSMCNNDCCKEWGQEEGICRTHIVYEVLDDNGDHLKYCLSDENMQVAKELIEKYDGYLNKDGMIVSLVIPIKCNKYETIGEVSDRLLELANKFKKQDLLFHRMTPEQQLIYFEDYVLPYHPMLREKYFSDNNKLSLENMIEFLKDAGCNDIIYKEGIFWDSEASYERHEKFVSESKK